MKFILAVCCISLMVVFVTAGVPLPILGDDQSNLSDSCKIPKCPEVKSLENEERVFTLPYPLDCLQYVECRGSDVRILACPADEVFDKNTFTCGPRSRIRCVPCYQEPPQ